MFYFSMLGHMSCIKVYGSRRWGARIPSQSFNPRQPCLLSFHSQDLCSQEPSSQHLYLQQSLPSSIYIHTHRYPHACTSCRVPLPALYQRESILLCPATALWLSNLEVMPGPSKHADEKHSLISCVLGVRSTGEGKEKTRVSHDMSPGPESEGGWTEDCSLV